MVIQHEQLEGSIIFEDQNYFVNAFEQLQPHGKAHKAP